MEEDFLNSIPTRHVKEEVAACPSFSKTEAAVKKKLNSGHSPGLDDICAEALKHGGGTLIKRLHLLLQDS